MNRVFAHASRYFIVASCLFIHMAVAQTTAFNYQGRLSDGANPANGSYDLQFRLFDAITSGNQIASTLFLEDVMVTNGVFSVSLDFGAAAFPGANRWLEIGVRPGASSGSFTTLSPLQPITSSPYAVKSLYAATADGLSATCVSCVTSSQIASVDGSVITGTVPVSTLPGSEAFIHNTTSVQTSSNFNISGNGVVGGSVAVGTSSPATRLDVVDSTTQIHFGASAQDSGGYLVSVVPSQANIAGGARWNGSTWVARTTEASVLGLANGNFTFSGNGGLTSGAPFTPTTRMTILNNGRVGIGTTQPSSLLEVAAQDGLSITGFQPYLTLRDTNASNARGVIQSVNGHINLVPESFIGGSAAMIVRSGTGNVGIGTDNPLNKLEVRGGSGTAIYGASNDANGVYGLSFTGSGVHGESQNASGTTGLSISGSGIYGFSDQKEGVYGQSSFDTGVYGTGHLRGVAGFSADGYGIYGQSDNLNPTAHAGFFQGRVRITGNLTVDGTFSNPSDARLKQQIAPLPRGLAEMLKLRPVTWKWNADPEGPLQLGLIAQEVQSVLPELVQNSDGTEPLALNYLGLLPVAIKAIQEQQAQIEQQQLEMKQQQSQIDGLKAIVCLDHPQATVCK
jgi:Chaperone of endosialidase